MYDTPSLFDNLEHDDAMRRTASRRALAMASTRVDQRFGSFFRGAQSIEEFEARLALVQGDFDLCITSAAQEADHNAPEHIKSTILEHYRTAADKVEFAKTPEENEEDGNPPEAETHVARAKRKWSVTDPASLVPPTGPAVTPPVPNPAAGVDPQAGGVAPVNPGQGVNQTQPFAGQQPLPQVPGQVPGVPGQQPFLANSYNPADQKSDGEGASVLDALDESDDSDESDETKKTARVWKVAEGSGDWIEHAVKKPGELHRELDVPEGEKIPADKLEEAEHSSNPKERERADFAKNMKGLHHGADQNNTGLGGPEPKIDKSRGNPGEPEGALEDNGRWPTKRKDITEPIKADNKSELKEIGEGTTEREKLKGNKGDAGYDDGGVNKGPHTKTFPNDGQTKPVTRETQSFISFPSDTIVNSAFQTL